MQVNYAAGGGDHASSLMLQWYVTGEPEWSHEVAVELPSQLVSHPALEQATFDELTGIYTLDTLLRGRLDLLPAVLHHLALPAAALSTIPMAIIARITRGSMLEVLSADYIRTARAKGSSLLRVILRHALPNAAVPITNIVGLQIGLLLSGAVLTETVFDWPGLGLYVKDAVVGVAGSASSGEMTPNSAKKIGSCL